MTQNGAMAVLHEEAIRRNKSKLVNGGRVDPGQPVDPLTRVDMFDPSLVKIDKFPIILMGWTG